MLEALRIVHEMMAQAAGRGRCRRHWRLDVAQEDGAHAFSLAFGFALEPERLAVRE